MVLCLAETTNEYLQGTEIGSDASLENEIFMEHKNLNVQMSELSSSILVPTYLSTRLFSGTFPALNQTWNTCEVVADRGFQQLFNFNFTFKASAGHPSSMTAPIHW